MDETLLLPSPNWFLVSNFAVSKDGWFIYGGPSKSICVLEPLNEEKCVISGKQSYRAHVASRAHGERVVCVDISSEFPEKRNFLSGSADGSVKQWTLNNVNQQIKIKATHSHELHCDKEELVGVGYSTNTVAITVGVLGNIVKWDLNSNVCKKYSKFLANFKVSCMSCSPHIPMQVAVGTKQGVIFVLNLEGNGKIVYKVRGQDDEVTNLSWCPQFEVFINKALKLTVKKSTATARMEAIRNEPAQENVSEVLEQSGIIKKLPEDSFDESVVEEDDMFDIYKDHEADEFGHKKYEPEDIYVKIKEDPKEEIDYLAECIRLKQDIERRREQDETTMESLVEAMDKTHVENSTVKSLETQSSSSSITENISEKKNAGASLHVQKHMLATIGRNGVVRIWTKSGKLVATCTVLSNNKTQRNKVMTWPTLLWYTPNNLLLVDGKSQLLECNPLVIDCKNKIDWRVLHGFHKRGLFAIQSDAPRVQTVDDSKSPDLHESHKWSVYTISQDRNIIRYSLKEKNKISVDSTCGGFVYCVQPCPYDAGKMAISVGDGAVRVWQSSTPVDDDSKLSPGQVHTYWQNVQGKVLTVAWHPTKENLLAFGTGESRVGILDTSGKTEKPAKTLMPVLNGGVYSLSWGEGMNLYACGGTELVVYNASSVDEAPKQIDISVEGQKWAIGAASWSPRGLLCGSHVGAVALVDPSTYETIALAFAFTKMIHMMEWHPLQTSNSSEESPYKNLIAVCSLDKCSNIVILEYKETEGDKKELITWKTLTGHKLPVLQVGWNPHRDELLFSTSQDTTVRVWDVVEGVCVSIFGGHSQHSLGAAWLAMPQFETKIVSGGGDCCLRLWDYKDHKPEDYERLKHETSNKSKKEKKEERKREEEKKREDEDSETKEETDQVETQVAANIETVRKPSKKFLFPRLHKQMNPCGYLAVRKMFDKFVGKETVKQEGDDSGNTEFDVNFIKIFGSINELNEVLDEEMAKLLEDNILEAWITLSIFRGHIDAMIQFASKRDILCPYLVSMAPCVSFKYWKDATQLYLAQIDRLIAKGEEDKLCAHRYYGGAVFRKVSALLSIHDVIAAVEVLTEAKLFKEAYILCRIRYMDNIAEQTLRKWATYAYLTGNMRLAAICNIALGNLADAATVLAKFYDQETLNLASEIAKDAGRTEFASHVEMKAQTTTFRRKEKTEELLEELPSRIEMLLKEEPQNGDKEEQNGVEDIQFNDIIPSDKSNSDTKVEE